MPVLGFGALALLTTLVVHRRRILPIGLTVASQCPILVGYWLLDRDAGTRVWLLNASSLVALLGGYCVSVLLAPLRSRRDSGVPASALSLRPLKMLTLMVGGLAGYHLIALGLPILQPDVEIRRFDFTSSGLLGIPGRMFLYGLPFSVIAWTLAGSRVGSKSVHRWVRGTWGAYVAAQVASGFKGGLLNIVILYVMARAFASE